MRTGPIVSFLAPFLPALLESRDAKKVKELHHADQYSTEILRLSLGESNASLLLFQPHGLGRIMGLSFAESSGFMDSKER